MRYALVGLLLPLPRAASAADVQVAAGGSISAAIDQAMPGDDVVLASGTYDQTIVSKRAGNANAPITIKAATPRGALVAFGLLLARRRRALAFHNDADPGRAVIEAL